MDQKTDNKQQEITETKYRTKLQKSADDIQDCNCKIEDAKQTHPHNYQFRYFPNKHFKNVLLVSRYKITQ